VTFYTVLLQIHSGNSLQKIDIQDPNSINKLLQNRQWCNFYVPQCITVSRQVVCCWGNSTGMDGRSESNPNTNAFNSLRVRYCVQKKPIYILLHIPRTICRYTQKFQWM